MAISRRWLLCDGDGNDYSACNNTGVTNPTYVLTASDVGKRLRLRVTGRKGVFPLDSFNEEDSLPTNVVGAPQNSAPPAANNTPQQPPFNQSGPTQTTPTKTTPPTNRGRVLKLMSPFPVVRLTGRVIGHFTLLGRLLVFAPRGAKVTVICLARLCPYRRASKRVRNRRVRFPLLERRLRAGTVIIVIVSRPGTIGKYTRIRIRANRIPVRTDVCANPDSGKATRCPSSP